MHDKQRDQVYQNDDTSKLNILHKVYKIHTKLSIIYSNFLSPCSGLVVSGFSKRDPPDITAKGFLAQDDFILLVKYKHKTYRLI